MTGPGPPLRPVEHLRPSLSLGFTPPPTAGTAPPPDSFSRPDSTAAPGLSRAPGLHLVPGLFLLPELVLGLVSGLGRGRYVGQGIPSQPVTGQPASRHGGGGLSSGVSSAHARHDQRAAWRTRYPRTDGLTALLRGCSKPVTQVGGRTPGSGRCRAPGPPGGLETHTWRRPRPNPAPQCLNTSVPRFGGPGNLCRTSYASSAVRRPVASPGSQPGSGSVRSSQAPGGAPALPEAITPPTIAQVVSTSPPTWAVVQNAHS